MSVVGARTEHEFENNALLEERAIATLLLADLEEVTALRKGKGRADVPPPDDEVAFDVFAGELKALLVSIEDQRLARSIAAAVDTDHPLLEELARADMRTIEDGLCALRLNNGESISPRPASVAESRADSEEAAPPSYSSGVADSSRPSEARPVCVFEHYPPITHYILLLTMHIWSCGSLGPLLE